MTTPAEARCRGAVDIPHQVLCGAAVRSVADRAAAQPPRRSRRRRRRRERRASQRPRPRGAEPRGRNREGRNREGRHNNNRAGGACLALDRARGRHALAGAPEAEASPGAGACGADRRPRPRHAGDRRPGQTVCVVATGRPAVPGAMLHRNRGGDNRGGGGGAGAEEGKTKRRMNLRRRSLRRSLRRRSGRRAGTERSWRPRRMWRFARASGAGAWRRFPRRRLFTRYLGFHAASCATATSTTRRRRRTATAALPIFARGRENRRQRSMRNDSRLLHWSTRLRCNSRRPRAVRFPRGAVFDDFQPKRAAAQ